MANKDVVLILKMACAGLAIIFGILGLCVLCAALITTVFGL